MAMIACISVANAAEPRLQKTALSVPPHIEFKYWGLYGVLSYDFVKTMWIDGAYPMPAMHGATGVIGFQFRRQTGIGVGFSYWSDKNGLFSQMPLFLELRTNYTRSRFTPYTALQIGYSFSMGGRMQQQTEAWYMEKGGMTVGVLAGGRIAIKRNFGLSLGVGYQLMNAREMIYTDKDGIPAMKESVLLHNLRINFALNF